MWFKNIEVKNTKQIYLAGFLCFIFLISCDKEKKINDAKFKEVLLRIHQCEAYNEFKYGGTNTQFFEDCKQSALKESQLSKEQFEKSMTYFTQHPKEFEAMYDTILKKYP